MNKNSSNGNGTVGTGGELHQQRHGEHPALTTKQGVPIADNQNSLKAGARGPSLLEDQILREKLFHFDHERIPERVVHARGMGAHGYFENYECQADLTCADLFQRAGEKTPLFTRFSTVAGSKGSADLARDVRGFAVKFYTQQGNWDLVGNNIPVFFIQDAIKFPDLIHAAKAEPDRGFPQAQTAHDNFWDFVSLTPESVHMLMWIMSDRAIPRSLRFMEGFGVHTFRMMNAKGESTFVKFHWKPLQGMQSVLWNEALKINDVDPDFHRRDLWNALMMGDYPEWELGVQVFDEEFADKFDFDVLDATKLIPEELVPIKPLGKMVLNKVVDNFFAETEQVAFCTQNIVAGIDHSDDPLLQGRNFSYLDTQLKRLGSPNFTDLPINAPKCPMHNFQRDGHMASHTPKGRVNYEPNSWDEPSAPQECPKTGFNSFPEKISAEKVRERSETFGDHYSQARQFFISQTEIEQAHICSAFIFELSKVEKEEIRARVVSHLLLVDAELAKNVADGVGLRKIPSPAIPKMQPITSLSAMDSLSILKNAINSFAGRKIGALVTDNVSADLVKDLVQACEKGGVALEFIAPHAGSVRADSGQMVDVAQRIEGGSSVLYDAVVLIPAKEELGSLMEKPETKDFVTDAFAHLKFIAYSDSAMDLLALAGLDKKVDDGFLLMRDKTNFSQFIDLCKNLRFWSRVV